MYAHLWPPALSFGISCRLVSFRIVPIRPNPCGLFFSRSFAFGRSPAVRIQIIEELGHTSLPGDPVDGSRRQENSPTRTLCRSRVAASGLRALAVGCGKEIFSSRRFKQKPDETQGLSSRRNAPSSRVCFQDIRSFISSQRLLVQVETSEGNPKGAAVEMSNCSQRVTVLAVSHPLLAAPPEVSGRACEAICRLEKVCHDLSKGIFAALEYSLVWNIVRMALPPKRWRLWQRRSSEPIFARVRCALRKLETIGWKWQLRYHRGNRPLNIATISNFSVPWPAEHSAARAAHCNESRDLQSGCDG